MSSVAQIWQALMAGWTWRMAWRDTRRSRRHLLLYSSSIILGMAALIAIGGLGVNLQDSVELQAKSLLGADLAIMARTGFSSEETNLLQSLGGTQAHEVSLTSMVFFPKTQNTRLAQVRAVEGGFPFYGQLETQPASAAAEFRNGAGALVEESMLKQFGLAVGDSIKIGESTFRIDGSLLKVPGEMAAFGTIAPRVYIALSALPQTQLLQKGSLVRYRVFFKFGPQVDVAALVKKIRPTLDKYHWEVDTVEHRKQDLGRAMTNLYHFLNLVGFIALLLGGIGIACAIHVYVKQKLPTVAVLRSLGCTSNQAFAVYLAQGIGLGLLGVAGGVALGLLIQMTLPVVLADFLPLAFAPHLSWSALSRGAGIGFGVCLLFALAPLLTVRRISPLAVLRTSVEGSAGGRSDPLVWTCYGLIALGLLGFSISQSRRWTQGVGFALGVGLAFAFLTALAKALAHLVKRHGAQAGPFVWRQGVASLWRPNNRTVLLILSLGLGTFLILTLYLIQGNLIGQVFPNDQQHRPDAVLFDVQPDQIDALAGLLKSQNLPVLERTPVVTMRLAAVKGKTVEQIRKEPGHRHGNWALRREYRSTYRDHLVDSEKLTAGRFIGQVSSDTLPVPVSVEDGIARNLGIGLGDELDFDVQGVPLKAVVASLREVDWRRLEPNFFMVFPTGVLEQAPAFHVLVTRAGSAEASARMQRSVVKQFPNVSVIDLTLVLQTIDSILHKITFVIRFMALFTVGTGLVVLVGSILSGRYQRLQESVLLRTLGASAGQIRGILCVEYLCLGMLASTAAGLLSVIASWALAVFVFKIHFALNLAPLAVALVIVSSLTVLTGLLTSRGICTYPPLEVLRREI